MCRPHGGESARHRCRGILLRCNVLWRVQFWRARVCAFLLIGSLGYEALLSREAAKLPYPWTLVSCLAATSGVLIYRCNHCASPPLSTVLAAHTQGELINESGTMTGGGGRPRAGRMCLGSAAPRRQGDDREDASELAAAEKQLAADLKVNGACCAG